MIRRMKAYPVLKPTRIVLFLFLIGIISMIVSSCKEEAAGPGNGGGTELDPATIQGTIFSALDSTTLQNAVIVIAQSFADPDTFSSDAQGKYSYVVQFPDTISSKGVNLSVTKDGFYSKSESFTVKSGFSYTKNYYLSVRVDTSGTGGGGPVGKAASIVFVGANPPQISVRGSGGDNEASVVTFVVKDKNGRNLPTNAALVMFQLQPLGTGAVLSPDSARTNAEGLVRTTLTSGTVATAIQIVASTDTGDTAGSIPVMSSPVPITIAGGLPDSTGAHFSVVAEVLNVRGLQLFGIEDPITAFVGDRYGNPVPEGTAIYFNTTGGIIGPSAYTNEAGNATVTLYTANPIPPGGLATIIGTTIGEGGKQIFDTARVVFSGGPILLPLDTTVIRIQDGGGFVFPFSVSDKNGNPVTKGHSITATLTGAGANKVDFQGDKSISLDDYLYPGYGSTNFSVSMQDTSLNSLSTEYFYLEIKVTGPSGSATNRYYAVLYPTTTPPTGSVRKVSIVSISATQVTVTGVGLPDSSILVAQLQDSLGNPMMVAGYDVFFTSEPPGATFNPQQAVTDGQGRVRTVFRSSTVAGTIQVKANSAGLESQPVAIVVQGGPPYQPLFNVILTKPSGTDEKVNFPGAYQTGRIGYARVEVKDEYGNNVRLNTPVDFTTNAGTIIPRAFTDASGIAQAFWQGGTPLPPGGVAMIKAEAKDVNGNILARDSTFATYSGQAIIGGGLSPNYVFLKGIDTTIDYSVKDIDNNPLAEGARIKVTATGPGGSSLVLSGDVDVTTIDTRSTAATSFSFRLRDTNTVISTVRPVTIGISVTGPNGTAVKADSGSLRGISLASVSALTLESITNTQITVIGGNDPGSTVLTFQLRDSLGNPVPKSNVLINFEKYGVAGTFNPESTLTDANGQAQTTFHSDTVAGIVQLFATTGSIVSNRVKIVIVGGKPSLQHFTFVLSRTGGSEENVNYPGAVPGAQQIGVATVRAGDQYGNPVPSGTPIYFTTTAGVIQGTASTDGDGKASVDWFGGNPMPSVSIVKATALGSNGQIVSDSAIVTYSGSALITGGLDNNFVLRSGIDTVINYRVKDSNDNPIAQGSTILVTASGSGSSSLILTGDINVTTIDTRDTNETYFSFRIRDTNNVVSTPRNLNISIQVTGANGTNSKQAGGTLQGAAQTIGRSRLPGSIALISVSPTQIQVAGTGGVETSTLIWEIRDSLGVPVDSSYRVRFSLVQSPGGGSYISPDSGLSIAATGRMNCIVHSGTKADVIQVVATVVTPTGTIISSPVRIIVNAGFPDQAHFSIGPAQHNFAGYNWIGRTNEISVQVGDKYSNPVSPNTAIYFNTTGGIITTTSFTDATGHASATLYSGNPLAKLDTTLIPKIDTSRSKLSQFGDGTGYAWVSASTRGEGGSTILDSSLVLFSGLSTITVSQNTFTIAANGSVNDTVTISDQNGNPLAPTTTVNTEVQFSPPEGTNYSATASGLPTDPFGDNITRGAGTTRFILRIADGTAGGTPVSMPVVVIIRVNGPNGPVAATITGTVGP